MRRLSFYNYGKHGCKATVYEQLKLLRKLRFWNSPNLKKFAVRPKAGLKKTDKIYNFAEISPSLTMERG
jgi:hypothetical protein